MTPNYQSGNVLFLILIAVALFAALSYAVTSSNRSSGGNADPEKAKANAAAIIQYGAALRSAVMRMKVSNGCTDDTLDFSNSIYQRNDGAATPGMSPNSNAPSSKKCNLFDPAGGGIIPIVPVADALTADPNATATTNKTGHASLYIHQITGVGTDGAAGTVSANDIVFRLVQISLKTCIAINDLVGVVNPSGAPPVFAFTGTSGSYTNGSLSGTAILSSPELNGHPDFCMQGSSGTAYAYYLALVER